MKIIAIALIVALTTACRLPNQNGFYGPPPQAAQPTLAAPQAGGPAPGAAPNAPVVPGLDDTSADTDGMEMSADGTTLMSASSAVWIRAPYGDTPCFVGSNPFISMGPKVQLENKSKRLWVNYWVNSQNVVVLVPRGRLWRRKDNGFGQTVLAPGQFCWMEVDVSNMSPTFMAYGYLNVGSRSGPEFSSEPNFQMRESETVSISSDHDLRYPLNDGRFVAIK